jgi:hypothetical protein
LWIWIRIELGQLIHVPERTKVAFFKKKCFLW